ncbi:hypothetical protein CsSME_00019010 [Camellia sinensis var. sinensis]
MNQSSCSNSRHADTATQVATRSHQHHSSSPIITVFANPLVDSAQLTNHLSSTRSLQSVHCVAKLLQSLLRYDSAHTFVRLLVCIALPLSARSGVIHADLRPHQCSPVLLFTQLPRADFSLCLFKPFID